MNQERTPTGGISHEGTTTGGVSHERTTTGARAPRIDRAQTSRREFIRLASVAAGAFAAGCVVEEPIGPPEPTPVPTPDPCLDDVDAGWLAPSSGAVDLPHLGGAPDTPTGWAVAAFVDAVVPGAWRDPTGTPGALDVGAPAMFFDPSLPAAEFVEVLAAFLDLVAVGLMGEGATFAALDVDDRDEALQAATESLGLVELAIQLAKLAWFASPSAGCSLGYPGANPGWVDDDDFSFSEALTTEITADGNHV